MLSERAWGTDDSSLVEKYGLQVSIIMGSYDNIKITTPEDLVLAELFRKKLKGEIMCLGLDKVIVFIFLKRIDH